MADLRIVDAPLLSTVKGTEKIPTGGEGNFSISVNQVADFAKLKWFLATEEYVDNAVGNVQADLDLYKNNSSNPHGVTKLQVGLGNVDNTADLDKPVSNATQSAIITANSGKADKSYVDSQDQLKADKSYVDSQDQLKADKNTVEASLLLKADKLDLIASKITSNGNQTQQAINDFGGAKWYAKSGGYALGATVKLDNGDIVKSTIPNNTNNPNVNMTGWVLESSKSLSNPSDLATLQNPKNRQRAYVESLQKTFVYDVNLTIPENGVTIVGKWEMETQESYYASWFADSTSNTSQALKIQGGYDYATSKKRAFIIDAEFWVDANAMGTGIANGNRTAILIRSNSVLHFTGQGKLKAIPNNYYIYALITACGGADNFIITYPKLQGEVFQHIGAPTQFGYGLAIYECSNGYIKQPHCSELTGDGIYVGKSAGDPTSAVPKNILIEKPVIKQVRRNGISFCAWDNVTITYPDISYVGDFGGLTGTYPKSGIDIEPEMNPDYTPSITCRNGVIKSPYISNCNVGIQTYCGLNAIEVGLHVQGITTLDNITEYATSFSWGSANCVGLIKFDHIHFTHLMPTVRHLQFMFDATATLLLEIDRVSYDFRDKGFTVLHNPIGIYAANLVGNVHINNFDASGLVFVHQPSGVDNTNKTLSNFKLLKSRGSVGSILDVDALKNPFPNTSCTIDSKYVFADDLFLETYRGGDTLVCSRDTPSTVTVNSASNDRKLRLEYDKTKTGYTLRLVGIRYIRGDGLRYTVATTTMRGAWIEFENVDASNTFIHSMSEGWVFS